MRARKDWWLEFFQVFQPTYNIPGRVSNMQARYLAKKLGLKKGNRFLDCPCGVGRISLPMAKMGIRVTGVDITSRYLEELDHRAKHAGIKIELHQSDMRRINFKNQFDAAGNLLTSFGYFPRESDNLLVFKKIFKALKPSGRFVLHVINRDFLVANFQPQGWLESGDVKVFQTRMIDYSRSVLNVSWHFLRKDVEKIVDIDLRIYSYHEIRTMLGTAGFINIEGFGSEKDEPISSGRAMMIVFAQKPKK